MSNHPKTKNANKQSGVALITVVLIVALLVTIIGYAFESQLLTVKRVTNQSMFEQSYQLAIGGEQWASSILRKDLEDPNTAETDHQGEEWNNTGQVVKVDVGEIKVDVEDLSGRLNLNSLYLGKKKLSAGSKNAALPIEFTAGVWMLNNLLLSLEEDTRLIGNLVDWMDADNSDSAVKDPKSKRPLYIGGAEDLHYTGLEKPYRSANQPLKSLGELRYVKGFNKKIIKKLQPYVVVLPSNQLKININTAPQEVLLSMSSRALTAPATLAQVLEGQQNPIGHTSTNVITSAAVDEWMPNVASVIDVKSDFFRVTSTASFDELSYSMVSMLYKKNELGDDGRPKPPVVVLRERKIL